MIRINLIVARLGIEDVSFCLFVRVVSVSLLSSTFDLLVFVILNLCVFLS